MSNWHVSKNHKTEGPIAEPDLINRIKAGEFKKGSLVWKKGMATWEPLEIHFKEALEASHAPVQPKESTLPPAFEKTQVDTPKASTVSIKEKISNSPYKPLLVSCAISTALFILFFIVNHYSGSLTNPVVFGIIWGGSLLAACISAFLLLQKIWRMANQCNLETEGKSGGGLKLTGVFGGIALGIFVIVFVSQIPLIYRVSQARQAYDKYKMDVDVTTDSIVVDGTIGPTFAENLQRNLDIHAGIDTIIITSAGGLVDQALEAAKIIEKQGNITVIAHGMCNSSCLIILMAGNKRLADWNMKLGFHATSAITHIDEEYLSFAELSDEADSYLIKRGVAKDILSHAFAKGAKSLELVPAIKLAESGSLTGLLDDHKSVPTKVAKWRTVEDAVESLKEKKGIGFAGVLKAIRETAPDIVDTHADDLYSAFEAEDATKIAAAIRSIVGSVTPDAMRSADGKDLYNYMANNVKQIDYLINMEDWTTCANYVDGKIGSEVNVMSQNAMQAELDSLEKVIRSASAKSWKAQPVPKWAQQKGELIAESAALYSTKYGINIDQLDKDNKSKCVFTYVLMKLILEEGVDKAPPILRWLNQQGENSANNSATAKKKMLSYDRLESPPAQYVEGLGSLYKVKGANTSPLLYSPDLDRMVNPACPYEDMSGTIRNQIGFDCIEPVSTQR